MVQTFRVMQTSLQIVFVSIILALVAGGCTVEAAKTAGGAAKPNVRAPQVDTSLKAAKNSTGGARIKIEPDSPADTVRVFYQRLREKRFRDALFLTNLRPAIEGLTENELKDLQVDFEHLAGQVPAEIEINGEIISGNQATVTARLPNNETEKLELQEIRLRKQEKYWIILTVDEEVEETVRKDGNKYFFNLRIDTHHSEAAAMLDRVAKAQIIYALQHQGVYAEMATLVEKGYLPEDVQTADSTGYSYRIELSADRKKYFATAVPAVYGKTGKLSFLLELDGKKGPRLTSKDNQGQPLKK